MTRKAKAKPATVVMTEAEITARVKGIVSSMLAKGLPEPESYVSIRANEQSSAVASYKDRTKTFGYDRITKYLRADTVSEALTALEAEIAALPTADEFKFNEFMKVVALAVDVGRQNGIDVEFVNPLAETMKRLSENALTFQGAA